MEIVKAWELGKKIYLLNPIPDNIFKDELLGINPSILYGDLSKLAPKQTKIEVRSFIDEEQYQKLLIFFTENAKMIKDDQQETHYLNSPTDLRIQCGLKNAKIWMKKGQIHDDFREETEIVINKEDFLKAKHIFESLGLCTEIKWIKNRKQFNWQDTKVCIDYTQGYGYIIELEKLGPENQKEVIFEELKQKLQNLGIQITSKEDFNKAFQNYKQN